MTPVITLWNPYDLELKLTEASVCLSSRCPGGTQLSDQRHGQQPIQLRDLGEQLGAAASQRAVPACRLPRLGCQVRDLQDRSFLKRSAGSRARGNPRLQPCRRDRAAGPVIRQSSGQCHPDGDRLSDDRWPQVSRESRNHRGAGHGSGDDHQGACAIRHGIQFDPSGWFHGPGQGRGRLSGSVPDGEWHQSNRPTILHGLFGGPRQQAVCSAHRQQHARAPRWGKS